VAILHIFDLLQITTQALDSFGFNIGETRISFLDVINGGGILLGLLWGTAVLSRIVEKRVKTLPNVPPSLQVLLAKLVRMALIFFSVLIALSTVGLDLSSFALLGGAIGVGIGFGLQKVVSNLVSGLILLLDRSIKPGDVIEIDETYGWINSLRARYASVITRDGKEHLIPNEDLITNKVINWSFSHKDVRVRAPIGISYKSDPREAMELCLDAARAEPRVNNDPEPRCQLLGFGENSIQLELRFWIADPSNGVGNIRSSVLLGVWDRLKEAGISIPFPQRDLHLRSVSSAVPHQEAILQGKASSDSTKDQDES
jgi:small-conductance mechanosensitive channel